MTAATVEAASPERGSRAAKPDGRHERFRAMHERIVTACRGLMLAGNFRPSVREVATAGGCSVRSVFQHFADVEGLHRAALDDPKTRCTVYGLVMGQAAECDVDRIAYAAVLGDAMALLARIPT